MTNCRWIYWPNFTQNINLNLYKLNEAFKDRTFSPLLQRRLTVIFSTLIVVLEMDFLFRPLYIFRLMMLMIMQPPLDRHSPNEHHLPVARWMEVSSGGQFLSSGYTQSPTMWQPGFDLPRHYWALQNRFRTNQGYCASCQKKWGLAAIDVFLCIWQTMSHIVNSCPRSKLARRLQRLYSPDDVATEWL